MLLVHSVGILVLISGLLLFARSQIKGVADPAGAQASMWKLNISGPPALLLIIVGIFVFLFPFTPWWPLPDDPVSGPPSTIPATTTTFGVVTTVGPTTTHGAVTTVPVYTPPMTPNDYTISEDPETCGGLVIAWTTEGTVSGWYVVVEVYNATTDEYIDYFELSTAEEHRWYQGEPRLCEWEFFWDYPVSYEEGTYYVLYVYSYDEVNYSEDALVIEFP